MKYKTIAQVSDESGMLPMKQGAEQEARKSHTQKNIETCNFIKHAFCIDGKVSMVHSSKPISSKVWFLAEDKERGKFFVAFGVLPNHNHHD